MASRTQTTASEYKLSCKRTGETIEATTIRIADDAVKVARNFYFDDINIYESFFIMLLNKANKVIGWAKISQGGVCNTVVDKKIICKYAIDTLASSVILIHNHPSGNHLPSGADTAITEQITKALGVLDIKILDHIILTEKGYYSFSEEGMLS